MKAWAMVTAIASAVLLGGCAAGDERTPLRADGAKPAPVRVGVALNYLEDPFFVAIYEGVRSEATRLGVQVTVRSVTSNAEFAGQATQLRALVAEGHDCYVVNPITSTNLVAALRGVTRPIVNVDSPLDAAAAKRADVRVATYIGTDDFAVGNARRPRDGRAASRWGRRGAPRRDCHQAPRLARARGPVRQRSTGWPALRTCCRRR